MSCARAVWRYFLLCILLVLSIGSRLCWAEQKAPTTLPTDLHDRIVAQYLDGSWDDLSKEMLSGAREISSLPAAKKADVDYIRKTIAECRPAWWKVCETGQKVRFHPTPWGHPLAAVYDPAAKMSKLDFVGGVPMVTVGWNAANMDNAAIEGELPFTKGENVYLEIWTALGSAESWVEIPPRVMMEMNESARKDLTRYLDFRGNVCGAYYSTPRARRLAIWNGISGWSHEYDNKTTNMSTKAVGALFAAEVLGHPQTYISIPRPEEPPADGAESKMVWQLQEWIRHHEIPLAQDKAFRDALKTFAAANDSRVRTSGKFVLPNGNWVSLDPKADVPLAAVRDKWIKAQYAKKPASAAGAKLN